MPTALPITDRARSHRRRGAGPDRETLCLPPYAARDDVEIVGLCDLDSRRVDRWETVFAGAERTTDLEALLRSNADVVDVLVPTTHCARLSRGMPLDIT